MNGTDNAATTVMNAGTDMMMIPDRKGFLDYIEGMKIALSNNTIGIDRLQDAVARIISVKLALGVAKLKSSSSNNMRFKE